MFVELAKGWKERGEKGEQMKVEIPFQGQELEVPNGRFAKRVYCSLICVTYPPREYPVW